MTDTRPRANTITLGGRDFVAERDFDRRLGKWRGRRRTTRWWWRLAGRPGWRPDGGGPMSFGRLAGLIHHRNLTKEYRR